MPRTSTVKRARRAAHQGKKPTTQAGEFVREEMEKLERGSGTVRSRKQAIGVPLGTPPPGTVSSETRRKAKRDTEIGKGRGQPSPTRSRGARKAARTRARRYARATR